MPHRQLQDGHLLPWPINCQISTAWLERFAAIESQVLHVEAATTDFGKRLTLDAFRFSILTGSAYKFFSFPTPPILNIYSRNQYLPHGKKNSRTFYEGYARYYSVSGYKLFYKFNQDEWYEIRYKHRQVYV
jgi:predicted ATPase